MIDAGIYVGRVMHHRMRPRHHRFIYRLFTLLIDVDRLPEMDRQLRFLSIERANLFSFHSRDHGPRDGTPLRPWVEAELQAAGIDVAPAQIRLLAMPRFLGYVFNPLSVYYCYDNNLSLYAIVYEVKNTFGEQHAYSLKAQPHQGMSKRFKQRCDKNFYVSPFIQPKANYRFSLNDPNSHLDVRITEYADDAPLLIATLQGHHRPLTDRQLLIQAIRHPFLPQKVIASIHYEALKLWLKGIVLQPRHVGKQRTGNSPEEEAVSRRPGSV